MTVYAVSGGWQQVKSCFRVAPTALLAASLAQQQVATSNDMTAFSCKGGFLQSAQ